MTSFPRRKDNAIFADIRIRHNKYDLFLFIEDEKMPGIYKKIINRVYNNNVKIKHVYPMKSKRNVLSTFRDWKQNASDLVKCVFIIDKDFDHIKGMQVPQDNNLIELEYYTIENYLISKKGVLGLLESKIFQMEIEELEHKLDWDNWVIDTYKGFKDLFIAYAIAFKYDLKENCSISPYRFLKKGGYGIIEQQVIVYIKSIEDLCVQNDVDFLKEKLLIESLFFDGGEYRFQELIKGKYIFAALLKYLHNLFEIKFDEEMASYIIADNMKLSELDFFKKQLTTVYEL